MNIFFLDKTPEKSAEMLCDKHVPKMFLESCQMLSTAIQRHVGKIEELYKSAYPKHPMTIWVGDNYFNFKWAFKNAIAIHDEYKLRFNKIHKSYRIIEDILHNNYPVWALKGESITPPPQCMPDEYKHKNYVTAYRKYYIGEKEPFAKWAKGRPAPEWWTV